MIELTCKKCDETTMMCDEDTISYVWYSSVGYL